MTEIERLKAEIARLEQVLKEKEKNMERLFSETENHNQMRQVYLSECRY
jgi:predicted RNase H-like nuclease (RuvC/YqgF family)